MRQIVLDTETTGLEPEEGHRIIEIGCVELIDRTFTRNNFHQYLQPDREIDQAAVDVHGITNELLRDKPKFADVAEELITFVRGAELIIHNAAFDVGFLDHELRMWKTGAPRVADLCDITDSLALARKLHPGQRNSLDALCRRYGVDNSQRDLHGALLDAEILADVYLAMTGGQASLALGTWGELEPGSERHEVRRLRGERPALPVVRARQEEVAAHRQRLAAIDEASNGQCLWLKPNRYQNID